MMSVRMIRTGERDLFGGNDNYFYVIFLERYLVYTLRCIQYNCVHYL